MTRETKAEIVVVAGVAALLIWLWLHNRAQGAGTGVDSFPSFSSDGGASLPDAPALNAVSPVQGATLSYTGPAISIGADNGMTSCNCGTGQGNGTTFGSTQDMIAWLAENGGDALQSAISSVQGGNWQ